MAEINYKYREDLVHNLTQIQNEKNMRKFLEALLTLDESDELSRRFQILKRLVKGQTHRKISADLNASIATVSRGAGEIKKMGDSVKKMIQL